MRQSARPRRSIILWWSHGPFDYTPRSARAEARGVTLQRHNNGHDHEMPPRLMEHKEWSWLFSPEPLTEEEQWLCMGMRQPPQAPRL